MNKITLISAVFALVSSMPVAAEPSSNVAFDAATRALLASGDPVKGKEVAANSKCNKCHSENGIAEDPDDPNLAGQLNSYLYKQLRDYQDKKRGVQKSWKNRSWRILLPGMLRCQHLKEWVRHLMPRCS
jgi:cytochrome c553